MGQSFQKVIWRHASGALKLFTPFFLVTPLLGIYTMEITTNVNRLRARIFVKVLSLIMKTWKQPECPLTENS
jgi:hypothetical protein